VNTDLEAIQAEMRQKLKDGKKRGETELEMRVAWFGWNAKDFTQCVMRWKRS
jgi:hypothetical protein